VIELMWWHDGWSWWWPGMMVEMIVVWGLVVWGILALVRFLSAPERRGTAPGQRRTTAEDILAERFARGEIDGEEYMHRLTVLRSPVHRAQRRDDQVSAAREAEPAGA
jgi:putative membrane protein